MPPVRLSQSSIRRRSLQLCVLGLGFPRWGCRGRRLPGNTELIVLAPDTGPASRGPL